MGMSGDFNQAVTHPYTSDLIWVNQCESWKPHFWPSQQLQESLTFKCLIELKYFVIEI